MAPNQRVGTGPPGPGGFFGAWRAPGGVQEAVQARLPELRAGLGHSLEQLRQPELASDVGAVLFRHRDQDGDAGAKCAQPRLDVAAPHRDVAQALVRHG